MTMTPALQGFISREFQKVPEVAEFAQLGRNTVYAAIERGELKSKRYGKVIRVRTVDALEWLGIPFPGDAERQDAEGQK